MNHEAKPPAEPAKILVVDDVAANRNLLAQTLESAGYSVSAAPTGEVALEVALMDPPDLILLDILLPGLDGFELCRRLKAARETGSVPVIFITAKDESGSVVEGFRAGGVDYVTKPFQTDEVLARVRTHLRIHGLTRALADKNRTLTAVNARLQEEIDRRRAAESERETADQRLLVYTGRETERWGIAGFVGRSATLERILADVRRLQTRGTPSVLITGESGTGKELIARAIHAGGLRADGPFITVNCPAIPRDLAEDLLFGHVRGAFTGAQAGHQGFFELADGGTLFLDEISEMSMAVQSKLLRVLEDGLVLPLGASQERRITTRVLAASNADFPALIANGRFRPDLYYRLARFTVEVPPLRERPDDIPLLIEHFLDLFSREMNLSRPTASPAALRLLCEYAFPGNVRELKNVIERALIESGGDLIDVEHVHLVKTVCPPRSGDGPADPTRDGAAGSESGEPLSKEEQAVLEHVRRTGSINNNECRRLLGLQLHQAWYLLHKMHRHGRLRQEGDRRWARYRAA
jgi:DNA-binding NtrC family response regulator